MRYWHELKTLTRAIVAASVEAGSLSNKDLIIHTPTLEELGLSDECRITIDARVADTNLTVVRRALCDAASFAESLIFIG